MSEYAQEQRRLQDARQRPTSGFASDPNEESLTFGKPAGASAPPSSGNALRLSDMPLRRGDKRKFSDSEPDEEELEFGRPSKEIKRAKTASPASVSYGTPPAQASYSDSAPSPARTSHLHPVSLRSSAAAAHSTNMVHGSSPLVKSHALVAESDSDDEEDETSDSDSEAEAPAPTFAPTSHNEMELVSVDPDGDEDDFLMAAFDNDDNAGGGNNGSGWSHFLLRLGSKLTSLQIIRVTKATTTSVDSFLFCYGTYGGFLVRFSILILSVHLSSSSSSMASFPQCRASLFHSCTNPLATHYLRRTSFQPCLILIYASIENIIDGLQFT